MKCNLDTQGASKKFRARGKCTKQTKWINRNYILQGS